MLKTCKRFFDTLKIPVIVCRKSDDLPVIYINTETRLLVAPSISLNKLKGTSVFGGLRNFLHFDNQSEFEEFKRQLLANDLVHNYQAAVRSYDKNAVDMVFAANTVRFEDDYVVIYINEVDPERRKEEGVTEELLTKILHEAYHEKNVDASIQAILALAGTYSRTSRVYIFEDITPELTRNTYEWCGTGVEPAIDLLQNLRKEDYNYDVIISAGLYVYSDTRTLPESDRRILYDMQGIKSIAILALYNRDKPLGYIGFDDTVNFRNWSHREIQILEGIASVVSSLINRRNAESAVLASRATMQTITDSLDDLIYVADLETYELKFVSKSMASIYNKDASELVGKPCWQALQLYDDGPCPFCPIPKMYSNGKVLLENYTWETRNPITDKWYMVRDNIITWTDGKPAHLETAVDITYRKQFEEQLHLTASTDAMTKVYNRKYGHAKLLEVVENPGDSDHTLCFLDIDELKMVNDTLGHEAGDDLIVSTVQVILSSIRREDFLCRWGGDEFILMLFCDFDTAAKVMNKILFAIDHFNATAGKPFKLSLSHGEVAVPREGDISLEELVNKADELMYKNKQTKKRMRRMTMRFEKRDE